ncbi:CDP-glycerol glycerophosphotransferase family protein [Chromatiaceae bacterium AAb-1]|nr:CDP-glycerol glycerophosphotransferase family protein [Chromatiaceae bacterium AAb-1]
MHNYIGFIAESYSFDILRPLQQAALNRGDRFFWFIYGNQINRKLFRDDEQVIENINQLIALNPDAVFVPGNVVPSFIPGLKVQVFHGFEWKKKGHWRIRGCFDLYCTQGPFFTRKFNQLQQEHGHFLVAETGWPKLDNKPAPTTPQPDQPATILYAPTFSPSLTSVPDLFDQIISLSHRHPWRWLVKFHPKMDAQWVEKFRAAAHDKLQLVADTNLYDTFEQADLMLSDTSSIITEFVLHGKPVITYRNAQPEPVLIDITAPDQLESSIKQALATERCQQELIADYCRQMHPYTDGQSSERILDQVAAILQNGITAATPKPLNFFRELKMRKALSYWRFFNKAQRQPEPKP